MTKFVLLIVLTITFAVSDIYAEQAGSIRGMIYDKDFDAPLSGAQVLIAETDQKAETSDQGNFLINEVAPGTYTVVISKEGYTRQVKGDVVVSPGQMTEIEAYLTGEFAEMEEFVVQDVQIGTGTEVALLDLRMESPALMDSVSSDLMSQAGAGDAASALKLVAGATVQDGKYAVVRGLPDRYVNSQMNSVRLPTSDQDKRAVQLDQFPSAVIESIQVSKTFTPDQQGDASGGAVNVILKGIPDETFLKFETGMSFNTRMDSTKFQSYEGGGVKFWGNQLTDPQKVNTDWEGAVGGTHAVPPTDYKWSVSGGGKYEVDDDITVGGFGTFFYEQDVSFIEDGIDDKYWVDNAGLLAGEPYTMVPRYSGGSPTETSPSDWGTWTTSLLDTTKSSQSVKWGTLGILGLDITENHSFKYTFMYTKDAKEEVIVAENTRGKAALHQYWPTYFPDEIDFQAPVSYDLVTGMPYNLNASKVYRNQTINYTERTTQTHQLSGRHVFDFLQAGVQDFLLFQNPELDWTISRSMSRLYKPDQRLYSAYWTPETELTLFGNPIVTLPESYSQKPFGGTEGGSLRNLWRIWKNIEEKSEQYSVNLKIPFEQWSGDEGYLKFGVFHDKVTRTYTQESFSNFSDPVQSALGGWSDDWSQLWENETHAIYESFWDVNYDGWQDIYAFYWMADIPLTSYLNIIGGVRRETTKLSIRNYPDSGSAKYYSFKWLSSGVFNVSEKLFPTGGDTSEVDTEYHQIDTLPSLGFEFKPFDTVTVRGSYTETIARPTFKELSPVRQQEYVGGDTFSGNNQLRMSSLKNYDIRVDYTPYQGGLVSFSYFYKKIKDPIEYIQVEDGYISFIAPVNYPEGKLSGIELEIRQDLGHFMETFEGVSVGANATMIESEVTRPDKEVAGQKLWNVDAGTSRDMMNAPEHLYNFYATYNIPDLGTKLGIFYTVRGDTLIAGDNVSPTGKYTPSVYEKEYGTLNLSLTQDFGEDWKLKFQAKNLLDPDIQTVYRSKHCKEEDTIKTSYKKGVDFSLSLGAKF